VDRRFAHEHVQEVLRGELGHLLSGLLRCTPEMGQQGHVVKAEQGIVLINGFLFKDVEGCPGYPVLSKRLCQRGLIDRLPALIVLMTLRPEPASRTSLSILSVRRQSSASLPAMFFMISSRVGGFSFL